jgi:hypothetical protein
MLTYMHMYIELLHCFFQYTMEAIIEDLMP